MCNRYLYESLVNLCIVYYKQGYMDIVSDAAEESMRSAIEEVKSLPHYSENGEVMKLYSIAITENPSSTVGYHRRSA